MTSGLNKDIQCHCMALYLLKLQITRLAIRPRIKWPVSLVIAYGHFNHPQGLVWVCMRKTFILSPLRGLCTDELYEEVVRIHRLFIMFTKYV